MAMGTGGKRSKSLFGGGSRRAADSCGVEGGDSRGADDSGRWMEISEEVSENGCWLGLCCGNSGMTSLGGKKETFITHLSVVRNHIGRCRYIEQKRCPQSPKQSWHA